ncbi:MAG: glycosyltransferase family 1 protein, partial [Gammaproteobacteria bacterium]|nr:glycosyltransferase family 1 protein [Gammaproteobacteria bacterium]NIR97927.1 glycosyltransferase family 1 protein [Gammaproteobacteria bacterium]NIT63632.1 glycosyltransferase family 1 protein [Gammaproteobacteria bacterium]NIV20568.1 alpha-glucan family phosphorylase [Gammaproteobacteria bacterium]NIX11162.1 alpha-glucan family phosphorylase [Gammaproteobacteria bacterium]
MTGTRYSLEVQPTVPERLERLTELANDLLYSWDRPVRRLFYRLDPVLWQRCGHNPKVFLRRVSQQRLEEAAQDRIFLEDYHRALSVYDTYKQDHMPAAVRECLDAEKDLVAYFCAEFGLHESLPIYSGGLGILAGDHCKAASDLVLPFVAVGLLYRQGYFTQTIDGYGNQVAHYMPTSFEDLVITPALDQQGEELHVKVRIGERPVVLKVWRAKAGHITLYLLDSDLPENEEQDRSITYQLYGGDANTRIQQEIVLGIGGVRALRALGHMPNAWHINEGHSAFMILERCREYVGKGLDFDSALELVAAGTVYTTHTPVAAGHDIFNHELMESCFKSFIKELGISRERFFALGGGSEHHDGYNMTALALRGSRFHNGVSRVHGGVASRMESYIWPEIPPEENPVRYVTNGVHVPTFLAREWASLFDMRFGGEWRNELLNEAYWTRIDEIPDHSFWSLRQSLKAEMLAYVRSRVIRQHRRNAVSDLQIERVTRMLNPEYTDVLILGFARRFATYKRATLLFSDPERLARILNDPERPTILIFAGKAHPNDMPGQHLIQVIHEFSKKPEFEGKIVLLEGYDLALGRKLVTGVDVWLNNPEYPLEASGTSGQKAGINGVVNLSVLDGWWAEGYDGTNGWAITPHGPQHDPAFRNQEESRELLDILEHEVIPLYFERNGHGFSEGWVRKSKESMKTIMPSFNAQRMVMDYVRDYYGRAVRQGARLSQQEMEPARELARWKKKISQVWPRVRMRRVKETPGALAAGDTLPIRVGVCLEGLAPEDVAVECLVGTENESGDFVLHRAYQLAPTGEQTDQETVFALDLEPPLSGLQFYKLRMYPYNKLLSHRFETGCMLC